MAVPRVEGEYQDIEKVEIIEYFAVRADPRFSGDTAVRLKFEVKRGRLLNEVSGTLR
ncbi:MAG: hypothetical protein AAGC96_21550 [Pseudomonadota bacterium]